VCGVEIVVAISVGVGEVGDDREAPVALAQTKVAADRLAERARTLQSAEILLDVGDLGRVSVCPEFHEDDVADHG
jgi:hypothetical protein